MSVEENSLAGVKLAIETSSVGWMFGYYPLIWNFLSHKTPTSLFWIETQNVDIINFCGRKTDHFSPLR